MSVAQLAQHSASDDSDSGLLSFANAPGPSTASSLSAHALPDQPPKEKRHRHHHHRRRKHSSDDQSHESSTRRRQRRRSSRSPSPAHRSSRHRSEKRVENNPSQKTLARKPAQGSEEYLWQQLLEDGIVSVDRRGDDNLRLFRETPKSTAPRFVRKGGRRVLGLGGSLRIASGEELMIKLAFTNTAPKRYMDVDWTSQRHACEYVDPLPNHSQLLPESADYVPLAEQPLLMDRIPDKIYDSDASGGPGHLSGFRSIEGRAKHPTDYAATLADSQQLAGVDSDTPIVRSELQKMMIELERQVKADPHDVAAWLDLVALQERIVRSAFTDTTVGSKYRQASKRAIAESQLEVYKRAKLYNPQSRPVVLGYLEQCTAIFDDESLASEWESVLESTTDPELVLRYVAMHQTLTIQFNVAKVVDAYVKGIRRLQRILRGCLGALSNDAHKPVQAVVLLIHCACVFLRDAGYTERAISVYQAVVEWYIFTPPRLYRSPFSHRKRAFEKFWDSGASRIGMPGACGWSDYDSRENESSTNVMTSENDAPLERAAEVMDAAAAWSQTEQQLAELGTLPLALPMSRLKEALAGKSLDPHSLVVFEDVENFVVDLPWHELTAGYLLDRFLQFLGVVGPRTFVLSDGPLSNAEKQPGSCGLAFHNDFLWTVLGQTGDCCESMFTLPRDKGRWEQKAGDKTKEKRLQFSFVSAPATLDTCDTPLSYMYSCLWLCQHNQCYQGMARHAFELLQTEPGPRFEQTSRLRLLLATAEMEWSFKLDFGGICSKRLLRLFPTCLALWNTYAKLHARYGRWDKARGIWARILVQIKDLPDGERKWGVVVRKSWALLEILYGCGIWTGVRIMAATVDKDCEPQQLVQRLVATAGDSVSAVDILCARKLAADHLHQLVDSSDTRNGEIVHALFTLQLWLAYAAERSCDAATNVYKEWADQHSDLMRCSAANAELALLELCSVHLYHSRTCKVYRAKDLRCHLEQAIQRYPHTTVFWEMFIYSEARVRVASRVSRQISTALAHEPQSVDLQLIGLYAAQCDAAPLEGYDHYLNSRVPHEALKRATRDSECWSPLVWLACISLECTRAGSKGSIARTKRLLFAAIRQCPWTKFFYLLALGGGGSRYVELAAAFSVEEKAALLRALVFLGLRTRASLGASASLLPLAS
ncbi:hypothetical protein EV174_001543 [Coemansia sp. RSA 2320]|nr:hypothetical protein EV174_001543 [Coemansia sp. RSA 2320]